MAILPKAIYMFNSSPQNPNDIYHRDWKNLPWSSFGNTRDCE
jgi:hypothetical protein